MSIKETIRAEVDARRQNMVYELYQLPDESEKYIRLKGMHDAYVDMLTYLDHLPEQPVEGLEEEVKRYYFEKFYHISSEQLTLSILTNIARYFAEWGAKHLKK